ncbi:hypothetical protein D3C71_1987940 [compost metagenome]
MVGVHDEVIAVRVDRESLVGGALVVHAETGRHAQHDVVGAGLGRRGHGLDGQRKVLLFQHFAADQRQRYA